MPSLRDEITKTFFRFRNRLQGDAAGRGSNPAPSLREGQELGGYHVIRKLGAGGMGQVYLAFDKRLGRHVALKVLPPELTAEAAVLHRFKQEARTASSLNHPNILTIYDFVELDSTEIIVSEFVEGGTLRMTLERDTVDLSTALDIVSQIASALVAAHEAGVVHRDLKPTNIMIRPDGYVKVIDFGLAKLAERSGVEYGFTRPGSVLGTAGYMSPEQARGEEVDPRTDLWSLGVILYELVTGHPPFEGRTDNHLIVSILDDPPRPLPPGVPGGVAQILSRALEKDRGRRYPSARAFLADVEAIRHASGIQAIARIPPARRSHSYLLWTSGLALLVTASALWWWPLGGRWKILGPPWVDYEHLERLTFEGNVQLATISPDGRSLAFTVPAVGGEQLRLRDLGSRGDRALPVCRGHVNGITFSPDSKTLFYVLRDPKKEMGVLYSVPVDSLEQTPGRTILGDVDGPVAFSPGGESFAFLRRSDRQSRDSIMVAGENNARDARPVVSLSDTEIFPGLAWTSKFGIAAVAFPSRLRSATRPTLLLLSPEGRVAKQLSIQELRTLKCPVSINGGDLLVFAGRRQGAELWHLLEIFTRTGEVRDVRTEPASFDSVTGTSDAAKVAAVRLESRSSIWIATGPRFSDASRVTPETENYDSVAWLSDGSIVVPSARSGSVNLAKIGADGTVSPLSLPQACVERQPAGSVSVRSVVYSSNCAKGGNDFNIWRVDLDSGKRVPLTSGSNLDRYPDLSPDGQWVVYTSATFGVPSIWKVPLQGGTAQRLTTLEAQHPVFSPDSTRIICQIREPGSEWSAAVLSFRDGSIVQKFPLLPVNSVAHWSPDANGIDYTVGTAVGSEIWRQPLNGEPPVRLIQTGEGNIAAFAWNSNGTKLAYVRTRAESDVVLLQRSLRK